MVLLGQATGGWTLLKKEDPAVKYDGSPSPLKRTQKSIDASQQVLEKAKGRYRQLLKDLDGLLGRQPPPTQAEIEAMDPLSRDLYEKVQQAGFDYQHEMDKLDSDKAVWTEKAQFILAKTRQDWISPPIQEKFQAEMEKDLEDRDRKVVLSCRFADEYFEDVKVEESVVLDFAVCIYDYVFKPTITQKEKEPVAFPGIAALPAVASSWEGLESKFQHEAFAWAIVQKTLETEPSFRDDFKEVNADLIYEIAMARSNVGHVRTAACYIWAKIQRKAGGHHMSQIGRAAIALQKAAGARSCWKVEKQFCPTCAEFLPLKKHDCCKRETTHPRRGPVVFKGSPSTTFGNSLHFHQTSTAAPEGQYIRQATQKEQVVLAEALEVFLDDAYAEYRAEVRFKSEPKTKGPEEGGIVVVPDPDEVKELAERVERLGGKHDIDTVFRVGKWAAAGVAMALFAASQWPVWIAVAVGAYVGVSETGAKIKAKRQHLLSEEKAHLKILKEAS